ncbi:MAG: prenyltransferase [Spirochaetes bacterium]|nr:prenyltransferase [Spirochaetota bacterium]
MRPNFLLLTPACVSVGVATAYLEMGRVRLTEVLLVLLGAVASHACVNAFNDYFDFRSGLDLKTSRTPFSGGSGTLPAQPTLVRIGLATALGTLAVTAAVGIYFVYLRGLLLLPVGLLGLFLLVAYTIWFTKNPILCLIVPGLGFGTLMVNGTHFALTGTYSLTALLASMVPFFLVSNLLLLNQFPDAGPDAAFGRRHFPITIGNRASSVIYGLFLLGAYLTVVLGVAIGRFPVFSLLALLTTILAVKAYTGARAHSDDIPALVPSMMMNVLINLLTPVLLALGLWIG